MARAPVAVALSLLLVLGAVSEPVTVRVRVEVGGEPVENDSCRLPDGDSRFVYDTASADPTGTEPAVVFVTVGGETTRYAVETMLR